MNDLIVYKPLTEVSTYSGEKFYKSCDPEDFADIRAKNESIYFDISKIYVASAHIKDWRQADPDDVMVEWETMELTKRERQILDGGIATYLKVNPTKRSSTNMVRIMIERIKRGENPYQGPSN